MSINAATAVSGNTAPPTTTKPKPTSPSASRLKQDTVTLSSAGAAALAAMKEATESAAVTSSEAMKGDRQAQQLLAREAARRAASE